MKTLRLLVALLAFAPILRAVDTTPPTLTITHTWIEKQGTRSNFKMLLDPKDETGLQEQFGPGLPGVIYFRTALNNPSVNLSSTGWNLMPWERGVPFSIGFTCSACVIELRARDAAGNYSPVQRRVFQSPFPYSAAPDTSVKLKLSLAQSFSGAALDCRGLFSGKLDDSGLGDDILQVDRATGVVTARRQETAGWPGDTVVTVAANTIEDSAVADYDGDGKLDLAMIVSGALHLYHNDGDFLGVLGFTEITLNAGALSAMNLSTLTNVAFADISGEGKPELIVTGTDSGGAARVGWLDHNAINRFLSGNNAVAPATSSAGRVALGDVTGDGFNDAVMIDTANERLIVFKNDAGSRLSGDDDVVSGKRPVVTSTGESFDPLPAHALAIGDFTGDGRADVAVTIHWWGSNNPSDFNDTRMHQYVQLFDSLGTAGLHAQSLQSISTGPVVASPTDFASDVIFAEINKDRFPEVVVTSQFVADLLLDDDPVNHPELIPSRDPGIRAYQIVPHLDTQNHLTYYDFQTVLRVDSNTANPHRLTAARYRANKDYDIVLASNDGTTPIAWISNMSGAPTAPVSIIGAASTDSDPDGTEGPNGATVYTVYPNGLIEYSLTIINNTASPLTNAIFDSLLPAAVTLEDAGGGTPVPSGTSSYVRWTETIPAETAITKHFTARVKPAAAVGSIIYPKNSLKYGTATVYSYMPKVTLDEPITFALLSVNSDSDATGAIVHYGEGITYRMRLTNRGKTAIDNTIIGMNIPTGTIFDGPVSPVPGTTQVLSAGNKRIDITVTAIGPETHQDVFVNVEARGADNSVINNSTMTALRPSGSKRTLAAVKTTIKPAIDVSWYSVYSFSDPRNQSGGEPLLGTTVHYGESIRYRLKLINRSTRPQLNVKVGIAVPTGAHFDDALTAVSGITSLVRAGNKGIDFTIASFAGSTYQPNGTLITPSTITDVKMDVEARAADYAKIVQSSTTVQVPSRAVVKPDTYTFECKPALEITLRTDPANLANVKPGAILTYQLQAKNWGSNAVTSGKVVNQIPEGTQIFSAQTDDGTGTASPFRSGDFLGNDQAAVALSATSKPAFILEDRMLVWDLGQVDPGMTKTMRYKVKVATDLESAYFVKGQPVTLNMLNIEYNFVGTANTGKRIFALAPLSATYAAPANADPFWFLPIFGKATAITVAIDTTAPLPKPQLKLTKHVRGPRNEAASQKYEQLPEDYAPLALAPNIVKGDRIYYVENDSTVTNDAKATYVLHYRNEGGAPAANVRVRDVIPENMTFAGFLAKDTVLLGSYPYSHFYNAAGVELKNIGAEGFTDSNGNGFYDVGEAYADTNGNSKYDGVTAALVRSFDLYGGDLAVGEGHSFFYQVVAADSLAVGSVITSKRGGMGGVTAGLDYTAIPGYHLAADELHFPVNGDPETIKVRISEKASFHLLLENGWKSAHGIAATGTTSLSAAGALRAEADGSVTISSDEPEAITVAMPYDVRGDAGAAALPPLSNMKMTFILPKGYKVDDAFLNSENDVKLKTLNASATVEGSGYVSAIRQANGNIKVAFPLDGVPFAWPTAKIIYDSQHMSTLIESGHTKDPAYVDVSLTGNYNGTKVIPEVKSRIRIDSRAAPGNDAKIFIGQSAPISVKRGDIFTWTIFFGTLDDVDLGGGQIRFNVPGGCEALSATNVSYNVLAVPDVGLPYEYSSKIGSSMNPPGSYLPAGSKHPNHEQVVWSKPLQVGTNITWGVPLYRSTGGAMQITMRVREDFQQDRIVNNLGGCTFDPFNAMPKEAGQLTVVVRGGDEDGQLAEITQRWLQGAKIKHSDGVSAEVGKSFQLKDSSIGMTIGGADVLQFLNGVNFIPLSSDRVMLIGTPSQVVDAAGGVLVNRVLVNNSNLRIVVGFGTSGAASLINAPGYPGVVEANRILTDLGVPGLNVLSSKVANIIIGGGSNLVRSGGTTFAASGINGASGPVLLLPGNTALQVSTVLTAGDAQLIGYGGSTIVAGGGGNAVSGEGGNILAPGSAGLIGYGGSTLVGQDGSSLIGHDGSTLIGHDGSTLIGKGGAGIIGEHGAGLVGQDGSSIVAGGGLNLTGVNTGNK